MHLYFSEDIGNLVNASLMRTKVNNKMPYMKYLIEGVPPELLKRAYDELGETEEVRAQGLKEIKHLIKNEPDLNSCMEDAFLLRFLRCKKYRIKDAFKTLKNHYSYKATYSGILTDFLPSEIFQRVFEIGFLSALEYRDATDAALGVVRAEAVDFHKMSPDEMLAAVLIAAEFGLNIEANSVTGYAIVFDLKGVSFHTVKTFCSPTYIYRFITTIQDVIPCRIKGYHFVNQPAFFNVFFTVAKALLSEKLASRLHVHGSDLKSLYKHVPQEVLPQELGGKQGPMNDFLLNLYIPKILSYEEHFIKMRKFGYTGKTLEDLQKGNPHAIIT